MHLLKSLTFFSVLPSFIFSNYSGYSQTNPAVCSQVDKVISRLQEIHLRPVEFTSEVKKEIISLYVEEIDPRNYFFSTEDLNLIQENVVVNGLCSAFDVSLNLYFKRVREFDSLAKVFLAKPVKFIKGETLVTNASTQKHLRKSSAALNDYRAKALKLKMLGMIYNQMVSDSINYTSEKDFTAAKEKELREKLIMRERVYVDRLIDNRTAATKRLREVFLNSIALRFDPHSNFFSGQEKTEFEESLSKDKKSFGISIAENKDFEIEIAAILPGSPAWNSNQLYEDDIIESIVDSKGKQYDLVYRGMEYVSKILKDPLNNELTFIIRSKSNEKKTVKLVKSTVENVENSFTGYMLANDGYKFGYIPLPSFYTDFETDAGLGCSNDVAKEILLLKKDGIQGLVLDLRNNGGGSIKEAIELSGLFIDEGPMSVYKPKEGKPYLLKDMNRGTVYDGPLIILVNSLSASASEFVSGCLQDYGRALIVGDVTYGKGTAQAIYPVDTVFSNNVESPNGYLKITRAKFYHVSLRSNQEKGIVPEILIPDIYSGMDFYKEKNMPYHLQNDSVVKKLTFVKSTINYNNEVIQKSKERIAAGAEFRYIRSLSDSLRLLYQTDQTTSLEFMGYLNQTGKLDSFNMRVDQGLDHKQEGFLVTNHSFANKLLALDEDEKEFNEGILEDLQYDPIIAESFRILKDFISFGK